MTPLGETAGLTVYDEFWSSMSCDSSARSLVSGDGDGVIISTSGAGSLTTQRLHVNEHQIANKNIP